MQRDPRAWLWDVSDHDTVWSVIQNSLPVLRQSVDSLLSELSP